MTGPLAGIRVLDLTRLLPGPFLTQIFAELGADVVKVEEPGTGDYARWILPVAENAGYAFTAVNRGKRSLTLDLKAKGARDVLLRLARRSDVLLESFRPGVMDRLGLGDADLAAANPRLVRCSLVGYGAGPMRDDAGHDLNYEAMAGILATQGDASRPVESAVPVADLAGAMYASTAVLSALLDRERTGKGARIEIALADAALAFNAITLQRAALDEDLPTRGGWELGGGLPGYRVYRCAEGDFLALGALEEKFWQRFCAATARPDLEPAHLDAAAIPQMDALFASRPRHAWVTLLQAAGVPATPVLDPREALAHAQNARFQRRVGPASPLTGRPAQGRAPTLGEHTDEVLHEAGYPKDEVQALRDAGILGGTSGGPRPA